jgi:diguanylate cyclase (GGDEF)-like protein/PAS domain S-box-containing protein
MNYTYANTLIVSALVSFTLVVVALRRHTSPGAKELAVLMASLGIWSLMYALRWMTDETSSIYFWLNMTYIGVVMGPPSMLLFSLRFTNRSQAITSSRLVAFFIVPIITLLLVWTDPLHGWFFGGLRNSYSIFDGGIWSRFNSIYSFVLMVLAVFLLIRYSNQTPDSMKYQIRIIVAGLLIPITLCSIEIVHLFPLPEVDLTPFSFLISSGLVIYGFFYRDLLNITPIAYSKLVNTSSDGMIVLDKHLRIMDMNPAAMAIFNSSQETISKPVDAIFASWPEILTSLARNEELRTTFHMAQEIPRDYEVTISPLEVSRDRTEGCLLILHDITTFKKTEEDLLSSENKIRSLFNAMSDVVLVLDSDGRYLEIAPTNPMNLARDPLKLIGKTVHDIFPKAEADLFVDIVRQALQTGEMVHVDYPMVVNNENLWFAGNVSPMTKNTVIWMARDITERKLMEQSFQESETRLELAQNIAQIGNWEYSLDTGSFWASREYYKIMGMEPKSGPVTFEELEKHFVLNKNPQWASSVQSWLTNPTSIDQNLEILREGEHEPRILHSIITTRHDLDGKPMKINGVIQDITSQKMVEKALEKRMMALTRPLDSTEKINMEDLFNIEDLQKLQDDFAKATGVASLITQIDGTPITKHSNFCRLCGEIIQKNKAAEEECMANDAELSQMLEDEPLLLPCKSIGLMHAGAPIKVGGRNIASWLIGQVRTEDHSEQSLMTYVHKHGINEEEALTAFREIPFMSKEHFEAITQSLLTFSTQLSNTAFQNIQQARFITERKQAEEELMKSENKLRSLFRAMTDVIIIYDSEGRYREVASTSSQRYKLPPAELLNKSITEVFPEEISSLFLKTIHQTLETKEMSRLDYCLEIGGRDYWFSANISPMTEDSVIWVARDITDRKKAEENLQFQSMHDILTGLYNRQYYETEIERLQRSRLFPISILMIDVDGLKWVNDHFGHSAGDDLLRRVAGVLKSVFRPEDMVARMGGDEFVVVLPETGEPAARQAVQRLEDILAKHNQLFLPDQSLGLSIGAATGGQGILLTEVFKQADQAMYIKKARKREQAAHDRLIR